MKITKRKIVAMAVNAEAGKSQAKMGDAMTLFDRIFDAFIDCAVDSPQETQLFLNTQLSEATKRRVKKIKAHQKAMSKKAK
jgi:hypothetical protein